MERVSDERLEQLKEQAMLRSDTPDFHTAICELQRMRAAVPKLRRGEADEYNDGWNACIDAYERAMKGEQ